MAGSARQDEGRSGKADVRAYMIERRCLFVFYAEHNNKIERGLSGT
jgi:hypothetical protein